MASLALPSPDLQVLIRTLRAQLYASLERDATVSLRIVSPLLIKVLEQAQLEGCRREEVLGPEISAFMNECSKSEEHTTRYLVHQIGPFDLSFLHEINRSIPDASRKRSSVESPEQAKKKSKSGHDILVDGDNDGSEEEGLQNGEGGQADQASQGVELSDGERDLSEGSTTRDQTLDSAYEQYEDEEDLGDVFFSSGNGEGGGGGKMGSGVLTDNPAIEPDVPVDQRATTPDVDTRMVISSSSPGTRAQKNGERHGYRLVVPRPSRNIPNLPPLLDVFKTQTGLSSAEALKELSGSNKLSWYASRDLDLFELEGDARCARCKDASKRCFRIVGNNCLRCAKSHMPCSVKDTPAPETYVNEIESTAWQPSPPDDTSGTISGCSTPSTNPIVPTIAVQKSRSDSSTTGLKVRIPPPTRSSSRGASRLTSRQSSSVPKSAGDVPKSVSTSLAPGFPSSTNGIVYWNQGLGPRFIMDPPLSSSRQVSPAVGLMVAPTPTTPGHSDATKEHPDTHEPPPSLNPIPLPDTTPFISLVGDLTNNARQLRAKHESLAYRVEASKSLQRKVYREWQEQVETTLESRLNALEEWKRDAKIELEAYVDSKVSQVPSPSLNKPLTCDSISGLHALVSRLVADATTQPPPPVLTVDGIPGLQGLVSRLVADEVKQQIRRINITDNPDLQGFISRVVGERLQHAPGPDGDHDMLLKQLEKRLEGIVTTSIQEVLDKSKFQETVHQQVWKRMEAKVAESIQGSHKKVMADVVREDGEGLKDVEHRLQKEIDGLMGTSWRAIKQSDAVRDDLNNFKTSSASSANALSHRVDELHTEVTNLRPLALNLVEALTKFVGGVGNTLSGPALAALINPLNQPGASNPTHPPRTPPKGLSTTDFDYGQLFTPPNPHGSAIPESAFVNAQSSTEGFNAQAPTGQGNPSRPWEWQDVEGTSGGVGLPDSFAVEFGFNESPSQTSSRTDTSQFNFNGAGGKV